jgi:hypothetical protein
LRATGRSSSVSWTRDRAHAAAAQQAADAVATEVLRHGVRPHVPARRRRGARREVPRGGRHRQGQSRICHGLLWGGSPVACCLQALKAGPPVATAWSEERATTQVQTACQRRPPPGSGGLGRRAVEQAEERATRRTAEADCDRPDGEVRLRYISYQGSDYNRIPFSPRGIQLLTTFCDAFDRMAKNADPKDPNSARVGKVTHPSGAPDNHLLTVWSPGPVNSNGSTSAARSTCRSILPNRKRPVATAGPCTTIARR